LVSKAWHETSTAFNSASHAGPACGAPSFRLRIDAGEGAEYFKVEILRVDLEPGETPVQQKVHLVALVTEVIRTATGAKPDEIVNILYTITEHPRGWVGPGSVPIPGEKERTVAYLSKTEAGDFEPAAGRMSFTNF
jgi:phenylpyruvate tautomerase PptA (4-oxalocrotonate tautomerase family)